MESELLKLPATQGVWATLSVILIVYILKAQEERDAKQKEKKKLSKNNL